MTNNVIWQRHLLPYFGEMEIDAVKRYDIAIFMNELADNGYSAAYIRRIYAVLRRHFNLLCAYELIDKNPCSAAAIELPRDGARGRCLDSAALEKIITAANAADIEIKALIFLALDSGARRGELAALCWNNIDFRSNMLHIVRAAYRSAGAGAKLKPPKSGKPRSIAISAGTIEQLAAARRQRFASGAYSADGFVFPGKNNGLIYPDTISARWRRFLAANDLPKINFHALRHTCATQLIAAGVDLFSVQQRLGHSDIGTTQHYLHMVPEMNQKMVLCMQDLLYHHA